MASLEGIVGRFYLTTPLYYVNDAPHIGHTYTTVAADVLTRWRRMKGDRVHFLTGTDEHGQKVARKAAERGVSPQQHADELHLRFKDLWARLDIRYDDFIRTTEPRHKDYVRRVLQDLFERGDIYKENYGGWYSTAAERFWTEKDLVDGKCPDTGMPVEWVEESNYFFRMGKYADTLRKWLDEHPDWIRPESRRNEVAAALRKDVGDLCISRPKSRLSWGIPIPFDEDYVTYVWFDALLNYVSAVEGVEPGWPADLQLLGKDILATHTIYWGTMLAAIGKTPADCLYAHGWWTVEGQKMSKSLGNVVDPNLLVDCYGADAVRYVLMAEKAFGADGDFSHEGFKTRYNAELADKVGNLAHRALSMTEKWLGGRVPALDTSRDEDHALQAAAAEALVRYEAAMNAYDAQLASVEMVELARIGNKYVDSMAPWALNKAGDTERLAGVLRRCLELSRLIATMLAPYCPAKARLLLGKLGGSATIDARLDLLPEGAGVELGDPLFPRMEELPAAIVEALSKVEKPAPSKPAPAPKAPPKAPVSETTETTETALIDFEDFAKVKLRTGKVLSAERIPKADKLLHLKVDVGEAEPRTILAGIAESFAPEELVGRQVVVVVNLKPRKMRGFESQGMLLAAGATDAKGLATISVEVPPGTEVR